MSNFHSFDPLPLPVMPYLKPSCVRDLRNQVNIVDVISRSVTLKKVGGRFVGLCPFHQEKTPSFNVNPDKGFFKCFGCGKSGDLIGFVQETEGLNFVETMETLCHRFNVPLEYEAGAGPSRAERSLRQELFELHETAAHHYHAVFREQTATGDWMRDYWVQDRQFPLELAEEFKIGACDAQGSGLGAVLLQQKFSAAALRQCGLFFIYENTAINLRSLRHRFRGRLMIPIRDHQGRVVAFTARQTQLTPEDDPAHDAKYVNSPETPIFTKSHLLFNLDRARTQAKEDHPFVLVEGQLDALRCWSVGLKTAIAPQGTSITDGQLALLRRYHHQVECFFDGDRAGQKAALRFLPMALKAGLAVRFLGGAGDDQLDPDLLFMAKGLAGYDEIRGSALSAMAFVCHALLPEGSSAAAERKSAAMQPLFGIVHAAESAVAQTEFLKEAARHLELSFPALAADYERYCRREARRESARSSATESPSASSTSPPADSPEQHLLLICLHYDQWGKSISHTLPHDWIDTTNCAGAVLNRVLAEFEQDAWTGAAELTDSGLIETPEERSLVASLLFDSPHIDNPRKAAVEGLHRLRSRAISPQLQKIELALSNSPSESHPDEISLLFKERTELQRQLRQSIELVEVV